MNQFKKAGWVICSAILCCCNSNNKGKAAAKNETVVSIADSFKKDTFLLKETTEVEDTSSTGLSPALLPVKANFKRINSIVTWTKIVKKDLEGSAEGGEAVFYYSNGLLEKIAARYYGEGFQQLTEYYLLNGGLSFVFEKSLKYNRPVYYDSAAITSNNDDQVFDLKKSDLNEIRSYFSNGKLIRQINNLITGANRLAEQKRLMEDFTELRKME